MTTALRWPLSAAPRPILVQLLSALLLTAGCILAFAGNADAQDAAAPADGGFTPVNASGQIEVTLKDHAFTPNRLVVPAGKPFQILLSNQDATADEFDSSSLKVEKVVGGGNQGVIRVRALDPGEYPFMGEFNPSTAQGVVVAK